MKANRANLRAIALGMFIAAGAAGCAHEHMTSTYAGSKPEERSATQHVSDATLSATIKTKFAADGLVKAREIKVDSMRGVVTLSGVVHSAAERDQAIAIARNTTGVVEVKDNLKMAG